MDVITPRSQTEETCENDPPLIMWDCKINIIMRSWEFVFHGKTSHIDLATYTNQQNKFRLMSKFNVSWLQIK